MRREVVPECATSSKTASVVRGDGCYLAWSPIFCLCAFWEEARNFDKGGDAIRGSGKSLWEGKWRAMGETWSVLSTFLPSQCTGM